MPSPRINRGERRVHAGAHQRATQRANALERIEPNAAQRLQRQEIREQAAIEEIDRNGTARDIGAAALGVLLDHRPGSAIGSRPRRITYDLRHHGGVAQAKVETLGADGRKHVRCFANESNAVCGTAFCRADGERKHAAAGLDREFAKERMRARFELKPEFVGIEPDQAIGRPWRDDADEAGALAGQGHERERAAFGMELG